jgi:hypothetical protein
MKRFSVEQISELRDGEAAWIAGSSGAKMALRAFRPAMTVERP